MKLAKILEKARKLGILPSYFVFHPTYLLYVIHQHLRDLDSFFTNPVNRTLGKSQKKPKCNKISIIIPVYNGPVKWLKQAIDSVLVQNTNNWELIIVDDNSNHNETLEFLKGLSNPKIKVKFLSKNQGISSALNNGIQIATGDYITFLDQDDFLEKDALMAINDAIQKFNPDIIYTDENFYHQGLINSFFYSPHFKSDYSPDLLLTHNYITHLMVLKKEILDSCGFFRTEYDGAQDYDLILRASEIADTICHIRKVLYHWRIHTGSTSNKPKSRDKCTIAGKMVLEDTLRRRKIIGSVEHSEIHNFYRIRRNIVNSPLVSIIIPFKDQSGVLDRCLESIKNKTSYPSYEIILVNNNSELPETDEILLKWLNTLSNIRVIEYPHPFNYSSINNLAVSQSLGKYVLLMNNDIEVISPDWIEALLEHAQRNEVGAVGGKLLYPNGLIQHAGIAVGIGGIAGHPHKSFPGEANGYINHLKITRNVIAVTGALLMVKKSKYLEINGLDEINLKVSLNDVDFCLRLIEKGYLNIYTPYCVAIHAESLSRGYEDSPEKKSRYKKEIDYFLNRHKHIYLSGDPWYNPNFSCQNECLRFARSVPEEKQYGVFQRGRDGRMYYLPIIRE